MPNSKIILTGNWILQVERKNIDLGNEEPVKNRCKIEMNNIDLSVVLELVRIREVPYWGRLVG